LVVLPSKVGLEQLGAAEMQCLAVQLLGRGSVSVTAVVCMGLHLCSAHDAFINLERGCRDPLARGNLPLRILIGGLRAARIPVGICYDTPQKCC
jgi:hypothetical protein